MYDWSLSAPSAPGGMVSRRYSNSSSVVCPAQVFRNSTPDSGGAIMPSRPMPWHSLH